MCIRAILIIAAIVHVCSSISFGNNSISTKVTLGRDYYNGDSISALYIVTIEGTYFCGGTILKNSVILTAGHCCRILIGEGPYYDAHESIVVIAGTDNLKYTANVETQRVRSNKVYLPNSFHISNPDEEFKIIDDVCVIQLRDCLTLSDTVKEVKLPSPTDTLIPTGHKCLVCGHGLQEVIQGFVTRLLVGEVFFYALADQLQCADLKIFDFEQCKDYYNFIEPKSHICAGDLLISSPFGDVFSGKGSCFGDSGGPLFKITAIPVNYKLTTDLVQVGIVSAGYSVFGECANTLFPSLFTNVRGVLPFITETVDHIINQNNGALTHGCYKCILQ